VSVLGGLHNSVTWQSGQWVESLDVEYKRKKSRIDAVFAEKGDFHKYRKVLTLGEKPCVLYVGVLLSDLYSLAHTHAHTPSVALIDFRQRSALSKFIEHFKSFQSEYSFEVIPSVQVLFQLVNQE
jgi:hypothetical protein